MPQPKWVPNATETLNIVCKEFKNNFYLFSVLYYAGAIPFYGLLLYVSLELTNKSIASAYISWYSFLLFFTYGAMKVMHSVYVTRLYYSISEQKYSIKYHLKEVIYQFSFQQISLFYLVLSLFLSFNLAHAYNVRIYTMVVTPEKQKLKLFDRMKHDLDSVGLFENFAFTSLMFVVYLIVYLNILVLVFCAPQLFKTFFNYHSVFLVNGSAMSGFFIYFSVFIISLLIVDPFFQGGFVVRYFYRFAMPEGLDLKLRLNRFVKVFCVVVLLCLSCFSLLPANDEMEKSFNNTLSQKKYIWNDKSLSEDKSENAFWLWLRDLLDSFFKKKSENKQAHDASSMTVVNPFEFRIIVYALLSILFILSLLFMLKRLYLYRISQKVINESNGASKVNKLEEAQVEEEKFYEYEEEDWEKAVKAFLQEGDLRKAIRALYFQLLVYLSAKQLIFIQKYKTSSQYKQEVKKRSHNYAGLNEGFELLTRNFELALFSEKEICQEQYEESSSVLYHFKEQLQ